MDGHALEMLFIILIVPSLSPAIIGRIHQQQRSPTVYQAMLVDWMGNIEASIPALLGDGMELRSYMQLAWQFETGSCHGMQWSK